MSIVIPTFNRPQMLEEAVQSCLAQTVEVEIVVVDHGSSTETQRVCESFPSSVTVVRRERDSGPIFAWLDGVLHTTTEFVNLHFDDDLKNPRFAEECMRLMRPGVGMALTQARIVDAAGVPTPKALFRNWFTQTGTYPAAKFARPFLGTLVSPCAAVYRREHLVDALYVGRLPGQKFGYHGAGPDLYIQLLAQQKYPLIGYVAEELAYFRAHPGSITIDAHDSGSSPNLARAYDEARLAVIDVRIAQVLRSIRLQEAVLSYSRAVGRLRKRYRKFIGRYAATWRYALARLTTQRRSTA